MRNAGATALASHIPLTLVIENNFCVFKLVIISSDLNLIPLLFPASIINSFKTFTPCKRALADGIHAFADRDSRQTVETSECTTADVNDVAIGSPPF